MPRSSHSPSAVPRQARAPRAPPARASPRSHPIPARTAAVARASSDSAAEPSCERPLDGAAPEHRRQDRLRPAELTRRERRPGSRSGREGCLRSPRGATRARMRRPATRPTCAMSSSALAALEAAERTSSSSRPRETLRGGREEKGDGVDDEAGGRRTAARRATLRRASAHRRRPRAPASPRRRPR